MSPDGIFPLFLPFPSPSKISVSLGEKREKQHFYDGQQGSTCFPIPVNAKQCFPLDSTHEIASSGAIIDSKMQQARSFSPSFSIIGPVFPVSDSLSPLLSSTPPPRLSDIPVPPPSLSPSLACALKHACSSNRSINRQQLPPAPGSEGEKATGEQKEDAFLVGKSLKLLLSATNRPRKREKERAAAVCSFVSSFSRSTDRTGA